MTHRVLVIIGMSIPESFTHALARAYADAARAADADVRVIDLAVDPVPGFLRDRPSTRMPRDSDAPLSEEVAAYIADVEWADHVALFYPQWWGSQPAAFKAFIDAVFLSGFAFAYTEKGAWKRLLKGRTGRIVTTMDSPAWWNLAVYWRSSDVAVSRATLWYCGIKNLGTKRVTDVRGSSESTRARWLAHAARLGAKDGARQPDRSRARAREGNTLTV